MAIRKIALTVTAVVAGLSVGGGVAAATGMTSSTLSYGKPAGDKGQVVNLPGGETGKQADSVFLAASLLGRNEVPAPGAPAVGDQDGRATAALRIQGDQLWYAIRWKDVSAPTAGHIHLGAKGANGAVKVPFFAGKLPETARAVAGKVTVNDKALLGQLRDNPGGFYANLHTAEFPGGAVRGQLHKVAKPVDLNGVLNGGIPATQQAQADGAQEVPNKEGKPTGDGDGRATALVRSHGAMVSWAFTWSAVSAPTNGHIHKGVKGVNGDVAADLFAAPSGLPAGITGLGGMTPANPVTAARIMHNPANYYVNLHTTEFSGGAVRGQLGKVTSPQATAFTAAVIQGSQIYRCTKQADGTYAFAQNNVTAILRDGIRHSFVKPEAGPPQWIAPDRSAVTGKAVIKTPNGNDNIPELALDATQTGAKAGLLSGTKQILRLNTVGGVAPSGHCDPARQPFARSAYQADYVFLG